MDQIKARYEESSGFNNKDVFRIIESNHPSYFKGRAINYNNIEKIIKEGYKIVLLPPKNNNK